MLYDIFKNVNSLSIEDKESLNDNFGEIIASLKDSQKPWHTAQTRFPKKRNHIRYKVEKTKQPEEVDTKSDPDNDEQEYIEQRPRGLHVDYLISSTQEKNAALYDPETPKQMLELIDLIEKFISYDNNISVDNVSIFLHPLKNGASKLFLRPAKLVGLTKDLWKISRQYDKRRKQKKDVSKDISLYRDLSGLRKKFKSKLLLIKEKLEEFSKSNKSFPK